MLLLLIQLRQLIQLAQLAVDSRPDKALRAQLFENRKMLTLALADNRRKQHQFAALRLTQHQVDHLADRLGFQRNIVVGAARLADARIQKTQVVVNFGNRTHGRARVM